MTAFFEGRTSDSPYIDRVWRGYNVESYSPICPAETRWNLLFIKRERSVHVSVEGGATQAFTKPEIADTQFLVIQFQHGVYLPKLPACNLVDNSAKLLEASFNKFHLDSTSWEVPTYDNVEQMIKHLVKANALIHDPIVANTIASNTLTVSERTIRRRFVLATGMTPHQIAQIERARRAASLIEKEMPVLDVVYQLGYADQPHLTRSLKRFIGQTPTQITQQQQPAFCPNCSRQGLLIDLCYACSVNKNKEFDNA